jgi:hypothetical protein
MADYTEIAHFLTMLAVQPPAQIIQTDLPAASILEGKNGDLLIFVDKKKDDKKKEPPEKPKPKPKNVDDKDDNGGMPNNPGPDKNGDGNITDGEISEWNREVNRIESIRNGGDPDRYRQDSTSTITRDGTVTTTTTDAQTGTTTTTTVNVLSGESTVSVEPAPGTP